MTDKKKKIIATIVFVVFMTAVGIFAKSFYFSEEEATVDEITLRTPDVKEEKLDSISKLEGYNKDAKLYESIEDWGEDILSEENEAQKKSLLDFNPFKEKDNQQQEEEQFIEENIDAEQQSVEEELMALLKEQAEIDAKAHDDLMNDPNQFGLNQLSLEQQKSYAPNANIQQKEVVEEEKGPSSLVNKWKEVKEYKNSFKGVGGMLSLNETNAKSIDLIPAETVDKRVLKLNSTMAFRLKKPIYLPKQNLHIPKGAILYGKTSFAGLDRMAINIVTYKTRKKIYPVSLEVYDFDGRAGIHLGNNSLPKIPSKVAKEVTEYVKRRGQQSIVVGRNAGIDPDEIKTVAAVSTVNETLEEYVNKKRVFMPQKYHVWINIAD